MIRECSAFQIEHIATKRTRESRVIIYDNRFPWVWVQGQRMSH